MNSHIFQFLSSYLLMPLLAFLFIGVAYIISKKNNLLNNKKAIFYVLLTAIILALPGLFGFVGYQFMPYIYVVFQIVYLLLGWCNIKVLNRVLFKKEKPAPFHIEVILHVLVMFLGMAFFSLFFNLTNELQYGFWASTCLLAFIFPCLFKKTYQMYLEIPLEIYKEWTYSPDTDLSHFDAIDYNKLLVLEVELFKNPIDKTPIKIKAKSPDNIPFGVWFQKFLADYNLKSSLNPVEIKGDKDYHYWIFYMKPSFFHPRRYIDHELSVIDNKIKEKYTIIAKRVARDDNSDPDTLIVNTTD